MSEPTSSLSRVASLLAEGKGDRAIARIIGCTRWRARELIKEVEVNGAKVIKQSSGGLLPFNAGEGDRKALPLRFHKYANLFPMIEFDNLAADIAANGLAEPVTLFEEQILDGRHRYRALRQAKPTCSPQTDPQFFVQFTGPDPLGFVLSKNLKRRHLNEGQRASVAAKIANMRQGERTDLPSANLPKVDQEAAAKMLSVSPRALRQAKRVHEAGVEELSAALDRGFIPVSTAAEVAELPTDKQREILETSAEELSSRARTAVKQFHRAERERKLGEKINAAPEGVFGVILEDFEWDEETWSEAGKERHPSNHYPTAKDAHTSEEIVSRTADRLALASADCVLYMWSTVQHLAIALEVMKLRGFTYKSHIAWIKDKTSLGRWFRCKHEILLVGTRGEFVAPAPGTQYASAIIGEVREHSRKPDWQYQLIEEYHATARKLELNPGDDGEPRAGWERWGKPHRKAEAAQ